MNKHDHGLKPTHSIKKGTVVFQISDTNETYALDLKSTGNFSVKKSDAEMPKPDLHITIDSANMSKLIEGKLKPQQAFMKVILKIKGNMGLAMKLNAVLVVTPKKLPKPKL